MKAVRLVEYGGKLLFNDVPTAGIARDEILVKIKSSAVNHLDLVKASGTARQILPVDLPWIPGHEFSGVVEQIGSEVAAYAPGDAVFAANETGGAYAEYLAVKPAAIARNLHPWSLGKGTNDPDSWWCRRCGGLCSAIGIACRRHRHCHGKRRR